MNTMDCTDIKALLSAIVDDELDREHRHTAERHLAECAGCRALVNEAEGLNDLILIDARARAADGGLPVGFEDRVLAQTIHIGPLRTRFGWGAWSGWIAAAASLTFAVIVWTNNHSSVNTPGEQIATLTGPTSTGEVSTMPAPSPSVARPASYTTGTDLRSQTFDGDLPAEMFHLRRASWQDQTLPFEPVGLFGQLADAESTGASPAFATSAARAISNIQPITREDADTLYSAAVQIERFADADLQSFAQIESIRRAIEADDLLSKLTEARSRLSDADRLAVFGAESILLRVAFGPLDRNDALEIQNAVRAMDLAEAIESLSKRRETPTGASH
jgi:hypothetical protein